MFFIKLKDYVLAHGAYIAVLAFVVAIEYVALYSRFSATMIPRTDCDVRARNTINAMREECDALISVAAHKLCGEKYLVNYK